MGGQNGQNDLFLPKMTKIHRKDQPPDPPPEQNPPQRPAARPPPEQNPPSRPTERPPPPANPTATTSRPTPPPASPVSSAGPPPPRSEVPSPLIDLTKEPLQRAREILLRKRRVAAVEHCERPREKSFAEVFEQSRVWDIWNGATDIDVASKTDAQIRDLPNESHEKRQFCVRSVPADQTDREQLRWVLIMILTQRRREQ